MERIELIEQTINKIDDLIKEQLPESKYQFELYDLTTNTKHFRGLDEPFHWGSVYKLFVVAEIIKMSEEGLLNMNEEIELQKNIFKNGSGVLKCLTNLNKLTYIDTCKIAIAISDNLCADELLNVVGLERFNKLFQVANTKKSLLKFNLNDTVIELFSTINSDKKVSFYRSENFVSQFNIALENLLKQNYTNARDLNTALHFILNDYLTVNGRKLFIEIMSSPTVYPRIEAYTIFSPIKIIGKGGSLGYQTAFNQSIIILDNKYEKLLAIGSFLLKENRHRNYETVDKFGLIGLEIANLYEQLYQQTQ